MSCQEVVFYRNSEGKIDSGGGERKKKGGLARCGACLSLFRARGAVVDRTFAAPAAVGRTPMTKIQQRGAPDHFRHFDSQIRGQGLLTPTQPPFPCFLTF